MIYIEAVEEFEGEGKSLFLGGGITNCPDWQQDMIYMINDDNLDAIIFNPRRKNFPIDDPNASEEQITWEHKMMRKASAICFWFPCETLCPIVLYELGAWSMTDKPLFVGVHPKYERMRDVIIQTKLVRPEIEIMFSVTQLYKQIMEFFLK